LIEGGWKWLNCFNHPKKQGLILSLSPPAYAGVHWEFFVVVVVVFSHFHRTSPMVFIPQMKLGTPPPTKKNKKENKNDDPDYI